MGADISFDASVMTRSGNTIAYVTFSKGGGIKLSPSLIWGDYTTIACVTLSTDSMSTSNFSINFQLIARKNLGGGWKLHYPRGIKCMYSFGQLQPFFLFLISILYIQ